VVIKREIPVQPENIEDCLHPITKHRRVAIKPKRDEVLHVLCQVGRQGDPDRVSGNLFIPEAMPRREAQFAPGKLAQAIEGLSKGGLFPLLASRKVMPPPVEIAERKRQKIGAYGTAPLRRRPYDMIPPGLTREFTTFVSQRNSL